MESVGVRELKNNLSEYLRRVQAGEIILVTDRGKPVAELRLPGVPAWRASLDFTPAFWASVARGEIILAQRPNHPDLYKPSGWPGMPAGTAQRLIDEDRDERLP